MNMMAAAVVNVVIMGMLWYIADAPFHLELSCVFQALSKVRKYPSSSINTKQYDFGN
jgi:hypothetical protein